MSVITFPSAMALKIKNMTWDHIRLDLAFSSAFGSQGVEISPPKWGVSLEANEMYESDSGDWQALLMNLEGQTNQLELWNIARPAPLGTMRGTMTLNLAAAQGATTLSIIAASEAAKTLVTGDMLGFGTGITKQVVMVTVGGTADAGGIILVTVKPAVRNAQALAAAITWDKPKALFRRKQSVASWDYSTTMASGFMLDLVEDWR